jgi:hypothetical protein
MPPALLGVVTNKDCINEITVIFYSRIRRSQLVPFSGRPTKAAETLREKNFYYTGINDFGFLSH